MPAPTGVTASVAVVRDAERIEVETPYGDPSAEVAVGDVQGTTVAFLPRHGKGHALPPHLINYRANMWALRSLGVRQVLAPCAVGGLRRELSPGDIVVPDQLVDRTQSRAQTYVEHGAAHVPFADPYCPALSGAVAAVEGVRRGGTTVVVEGPRFSTRAESQHYAAQGWSLIGMTGHPEAVLAREMRMCYASIALVTDMDAGIEPGEGVRHEQVLAMFARNIDRLKAILTEVLTGLPGTDACSCSSWADGIELPYEVPGPR
jgi:5'-methylthioadenosine phosphorylase